MTASCGSVSHRVLTFALCALLYASASGSLAANASGQMRQRVLERDAFPFEPIEIIDVKVKKGSISFGSTLDNDVDWLEGLTLRVKNISETPISYISIGLHVNPPESGSLPKMTIFSAGSLPVPQNGVLQPAKVLVAPDDYVDIPFDAGAYRVYKTELQASKVLLRIETICFTDDTAWMQGMLHKRDPNNPFRWNVIESSKKRYEEFLKKQRSERLPTKASC